MSLYCFCNKKVIEQLSALSPLVLRIWIAQTFFFAGYGKVQYGYTAPTWFANLDFPPLLNLLPHDVNWFLAGYGEVVFAIFLLIGLAGRLAVIGLLFITFVAVYTVHFDLGFAGWNQIDTPDGQGFKVPLILGIMQVSLLFSGMGRWSCDYYVFKGLNQAQCLQKEN